MALALPARRSGRELLAALGAPIRQDATAADGLGAGAEAVTALPDELRGLIGTLHDTLPGGPARGTAPEKVRMRRWSGWYLKGSPMVARHDGGRASAKARTYRERVGAQSTARVRR
jgi:hypothetical protein